MPRREATPAVYYAVSKCCSLESRSQEGEQYPRVPTVFPAVWYQVYCKLVQWHLTPSARLPRK